MSSIESILTDITLVIGLLAFIFFGGIWAAKNYRGPDKMNRNQFKQL
jgi:hypothetical protein